MRISSRPVNWVTFTPCTYFVRCGINLDWLNSTSMANWATRDKLKSKQRQLGFTPYSEILTNWVVLLMWMIQILFNPLLLQQSITCFIHCLMMSFVHMDRGEMAAIMLNVKRSTRGNVIQNYSIYIHYYVKSYISISALPKHLYLWIILALSNPMIFRAKCTQYYYHIRLYTKML